MEQSTLTFATTMRRASCTRSAPPAAAATVDLHGYRLRCRHRAGQRQCSALPQRLACGRRARPGQVGTRSAPPTAAGAVDPRSDSRRGLHRAGQRQRANSAPRLQGDVHGLAERALGRRPRPASAIGLRGSRQRAAASSWPGVPVPPGPRRRRCARPDLPIRQAPREATAFEGYGAWMRRS